MWYDNANGDFNGDGLVDKYDWYIENNLLGMWHHQTDSDPWSPITSTSSVDQKRVTAPIHHFSGFAVSW